jgi:predicted nucleotidyltransferase
MRFDWAVSLENIRTVAKGLNESVNDLVFVGGATLGFYVNRDTATVKEVRGSEDVDLTVEVSSVLEFHKLEEKLRQNGFSHDTSPGAPICRWIFAGVQVDVVPSDSSILSFTNRWYAEGIKAAIDIDIGGGLKVKILTAPYFLGTKIEAFNDRGKKRGEYRLSRDLEDIVTIFDGRTNITDEIKSCPQNLKEYLNEALPKLIEDEEFEEAIAAFIHPDNRAATRIQEVLRKMKEATEDLQKSNPKNALQSLINLTNDNLLNNRSVEIERGSVVRTVAVNECGEPTLNGGRCKRKGLCPYHK